MHYRILTDEELERVVYIDSTNKAAQAEMLRRAPSILDYEAEDLQDARLELSIAEGDHKNEIEGLKEDLEDAVKHVADLTLELAAAEERIAQLTFAEDLV